MIEIKLPNNHIPEREYIIEIIFNEFLGLEYNLNFSDESENTIINISNGNRIIFQDEFFSKYKSDSDYLKHSAVPESITYSSNEFLMEENIPIIYGNNSININNETIECGIDIFASAFFMLTRWEEGVVKKKDKHNRFPAEASLAYNFNFLNRPVVNEYSEMLWNMMIKMGFDENLRKKSEYEIIPTHDVDRVYYNNQFEKLFGDVFIDLKPQNAFKRIYYDIKRENKYDTFDWLMDVNEKNSLVSRFYFLSDGNCKEDKGFLLKDKFISELVKKIKERGHLIGFHPGYDTFENLVEWSRQKKKIEEVFEFSVEEGRQHYLRFSIPETIQIWEDNGMKIDSTLGYSSQAGFRCGTANEFTLFNVLTRKKMTLKERPLIFMEETFRIRNKAAESLENAGKAIDHFKEVCRKYKMPLTVLFHNSNFEPLRWKGWKEFYEKECFS